MRLTTLLLLTISVCAVNGLDIVINATRANYLPKVGQYVTEALQSVAPGQSNTFNFILYNFGGRFSFNVFVQDYPNVNLNFIGMGNIGTIQVFGGNSTFINVGNVTFQDIQFITTNGVPVITVDRVDRLTVSGTFSAMIAPAIRASNVNVLKIRDSDFNSQGSGAGGIQAPAVITTGTVNTISIFNTSLYGFLSTAYPAFDFRSTTSTLALVELDFTNIQMTTNLGVISFNTTGTTVVISSCSFSNIESLNTIRFTGGSYTEIGILNTTFISTLASANVLIDSSSSVGFFGFSGNDIISTIPFDSGDGRLKSSVVTVRGGLNNLLVSDNTVVSCLMGVGAFLALRGGAQVPNVGQIYASNNQIEGNQLTAFYFDSVSVDYLQIDGSSFQLNNVHSSVDLLAACVTGTNTSRIREILLSNSSLSFNVGTNSGGVHMIGAVSSVTVDNIQCIGNSGFRGACIEISSPIGFQFIARNSLFKSNQANQYGGALFLEHLYGPSQITNCTFYSNSLTATSGDVRGGAIFMLPLDTLENNTMTIQSTTFSFNSGLDGAAIWTYVSFSAIDVRFEGHPSSSQTITDWSMGMYFTRVDFADFGGAKVPMIFSWPDDGEGYYSFQQCVMSIGFIHSCPYSIQNYTMTHNNFLGDMGIRSVSMKDVVNIRLEYNTAKTFSTGIVPSTSQSLTTVSLRGSSKVDTLYFLNSAPVTLLDVSDTTDVSSLTAGTSLVFLNVSRSGMTSLISISNLTQLTTLDASNNGIASPLNVLSALVNLDVLILDQNALYGGIGTTYAMRNLTLLSLSNNRLSGSINGSISSLKGLTYLDLSNNAMNATRLPDLSNLTALMLLDLSNNSMTVRDVSGMANCLNLTVLDLSNNQISADLSVLGQLYRLRDLRVYNNPIALDIGLSFYNLPSLVHLDLHNCSLSGVLSKSIGTITSLSYVDLSDNSLSGIESHISNNTNMDILLLKNNQMSDNATLQTISTAPALRRLELQGNDFTTGYSYLERLALVVHLNVSHNSLSGPLLSSSFNLSSLQVLDISHNSFSSSVPDDIGRLSQLQVFNCSHNNLTRLTPRLVDLQRLTNFDASYNQIAGSISMLSKMKSLASCRLASNNLICPIDWAALSLCNATCIVTDERNVTGNVTVFSESDFITSISHITNISSNRIDILGIRSGSVIVDMSISPPSSSSINEASALYAASILENTTPAQFATYSIGLLDFVSPIPAPTSSVSSDNTNTNLIIVGDGSYNCQDAGRPSNNLSSGAIIGIVIGVVVCFIILASVAVYFITVTKNKQMRREHELEMRLRAEDQIYQVIDSTNLGSDLTVKSVDGLAKEPATLLQKLGEGAYGVVWKASYRGQIVAMKQMKEASIKMMEDFMFEVELMKQIGPHPNVVQFIGLCPRPLSLVTGGDLMTYLERNSSISSEIRRNIIRGVALGMEHLAAEMIIHKDLAARNILVSPSICGVTEDVQLTEDLVPKVSDFGMSRIVDKQDAPESLLQLKYSEKSDVWSWGVLCIEILTNNEPFPDYSPSDFIVRAISEGLHRKMFAQIPEDKMLDSTITSVLAEAFDLDHEKRPTFKEINKRLN
ncbi:putative LRR receptor-like serine/threonine-protein kinase [Planoprotostelium fungivorum]|uniref:Putative LRR receptor-like serine/threonine-protein kinase n=1 Tax=Planoprotostelium fungivorum TaxID=1890364 RepID=A0A2P6MTA8_9EUKA|nr:putative LRR receptor-like serine/threonine-protein kinase [Planoprotostelium fungivorum]